MRGWVWVAGRRPKDVRARMHLHLRTIDQSLWHKCLEQSSMAQIRSTDRCEGITRMIEFRKSILICEWSYCRCCDLCGFSLLLSLHVHSFLVMNKIRNMVGSVFALASVSLNFLAADNFEETIKIAYARVSADKRAKVRSSGWLCLLSF